jgi:hypothetical protein
VESHARLNCGVRRQMSSFHITRPAVDLMRELMRRSQLDHPIPCVVWSQSGVELRIQGDREVASGSLAAEWLVGFYERTTVPPDCMHEVDSIQLVVESRYWMRLADHTLDVVSGRLVVLPPNNALQTTCETHAPER